MEIIAAARHELSSRFGDQQQDFEGVFISRFFVKRIRCPVGLELFAGLIALRVLLVMFAKRLFVLMSQTMRNIDKRETRRSMIRLIWARQFGVVSLFGVILIFGFSLDSEVIFLFSVVFLFEDILIFWVIAIFEVIFIFGLSSFFCCLHFFVIFNLSLIFIFEFAYIFATR